MNNKRSMQESFKRAVPPVAGLLFIALFVKLGFWQLDRAEEKTKLQNAYDAARQYTWVVPDLVPEKFQALEVSGRYLGDRQVLIDNVVRDGRLGYFAITPFEYSANEPLLLVNRGWLQKDIQAMELPDISIGDAETLVRGIAGTLPKVGIRPGDAFVDFVGWPRVGVYPTLDEIAAQLGQDVMPFVLLLDADEEPGFVRNWEPRQAGASTHYGYAVQWFAMAAAVLAIMIWFFRHGRSKLERRS